MKIIRKLSVLSSAIILAISCYSSNAIAATADQEKLKRDIGFANYYVTQFEQEVAREKGGDKTIWRSKKDALDRVQKLKTEYPNDPEVEKLFQRTKVALMKSKGDYKSVDESWLKYKRDEDDLKKQVSTWGNEEWDKIISSQTDIIATAFPAPDTKSVPYDSLVNKFVVLDEVIYPNNQFYGASGEYIWVGKPSKGYYFVSLQGRNWVGPYEAIKRFRRTVDASLSDVTKFTVLGKIVDITAEIPAAGDDVKGKFEQGWVVEPVAIKVDGHVVAIYDPQKEGSGYYVGEEKVPAIKDSWYSVKSVPKDVTPERLTEIFMTAIKEKNYDLYVDCIDPERVGNPRSVELLRYHWDLHQERFHREYVHALMDKAHPIEVIKGFDENNDQENFFLDDEQKDILKKTQGELIEKVIVDSRAYDENGKQLGSPHPHELIRRGGGRWYIEDYAARF